MILLTDRVLARIKLNSGVLKNLLIYPIIVTTRHNFISVFDSEQSYPTNNVITFKQLHIVVYKHEKC